MQSPPKHQPRMFRLSESSDHDDDADFHDNVNVRLCIMALDFYLSTYIALYLQTLHQLTLQHLGEKHHASQVDEDHVSEVEDNATEEDEQDISRFVSQYLV